MILKNWEVEGYKSIAESHELKFEGVNVFVGENNTGKSSVIDALLDYKNDLFPVANGIESSWAHIRTTGKKIDGRIRLSFEFELEEDERRAFLERVAEEPVMSDREVESCLERDDFKAIQHDLVIDSFPDPGSLVSGESNMFSTYKDEKVALRRGGLHSNEDTEFLKFNTLDSVEYGETRDREWVELKKVMMSSIDSWDYISAFRRPESMPDAERDLNLGENADNLSKVLLTLSGEGDDRFDQISSEYAQIMKGVDGIRAHLPEGSKTTVVVDESIDDFENGFTLEQISSGSKEILTLITQIVLSSGNSDLLLIEEPELHLHPNAEREIFRFIEDQLDGNGTQVVVSTHSNIFSRDDFIDRIVRVKRDGYSNLVDISDGEVGGELKDLGYRYSGMFKSDAVVVVEGITDKQILRRMARKYDFSLDEHRIGIVDMEDKSKLMKHSRSMVKLFDVLSIPYLFIMDLDTDEGSEDGGEDDDQEKSPKEVKGALIDFVNRNDDDDAEITWDKIRPDQIHVWENDEIEAYLLSDKEAILETFPLDGEDELERILEREKDNGPTEQLKAICEQSRDGLPESMEMHKPTDTYDLAENVQIENVPGEFHEVMEQIASLVDAQSKVQEKKPE